MTTLISIYNSSGLKGRCDARCYAAQGTECNCICGGINHKAGLEQAQANTAGLVIDEETAERFLANHGNDTKGARVVK